MINPNVPNTAPIIIAITLSFEPSLVFSGVVASVLDAVVVGGSDLNVMISMFNMAKSIYKDHFRISCSKILSNVVILQCPK